MRSWHKERPLMLKRWAEEKQEHLNEDRRLGKAQDSFEQCHCSAGPGLTRKARPSDRPLTAFIVTWSLIPIKKDAVEIGLKLRHSYKMIEKATPSSQVSRDDSSIRRTNARFSATSPLGCRTQRIDSCEAAGIDSSR